MDPATESIIQQFARQSAKWEQSVFGRWYADFRAHRTDLSKSAYPGLVTEKYISARGVGKKGGRKKIHINVQGPGNNLYHCFVTKNSRGSRPVPTGGIRNSVLLGYVSHLGTAMEVFADKELRDHRSHERRVKRRRREAHARYYHSQLDTWAPPNFYPRFKPMARFQHGLVSWNFTGKMPTSIVLSHPFEGPPGRTFTVSVVGSDDPRYVDRMGAIWDALEHKRKLAVEFHYHDDGQRRDGWYAHVSVPVVPMVEPATVDRIMGIDVGERNPATFVVLGGPDGVMNRVGAPKLYSGLSTRHELERQMDRTRRLRSGAARGSRGMRLAFKRAKGKHARILNTLAHQVSHDVVWEAKARDVGGIAMEDLSDFTPGEKGRPRMRSVGRRAKKMRRLLSRWNRGQVQDAIRYKAKNEGIRIAGRNGSGVRAKWTSSTCPKCHTLDKGARDRTGHTFRCRVPGCGYVDNDDVTGAANIAVLGWAYFHKDSPPIYGHANAGVDSPGSSGSGEGGASSPQATVGGPSVPSPHTTENSENGTGVPTPAPTGGVVGRIDTVPTSHSDIGGPARDGASATEVTPFPVGARNAISRRGPDAVPSADVFVPRPGCHPLENGCFSRGECVVAVAMGGRTDAEWKTAVSIWTPSVRPARRNGWTDGCRMEADCLDEGVARHGCRNGWTDGCRMEGELEPGASRGWRLVAMGGRTDAEWKVRPVGRYDPNPHVAMGGRTDAEWKQEVI